MSKNDQTNHIVVDAKHIDDCSPTELSKPKIILAGEEMQVVIQHPEGGELDIRIGKSGLTREKNPVEK